MTSTAIYVCPRPRDSKWQIGICPANSQGLLLIGWLQRPTPVDSGVPAPVASLLAAAITSIAEVTYFCQSSGSEPPADGPERMRAIGKDTLGERIASTVQRLPKNAALATTRNPQTARKLFYASGFSWELQSQIALLSKPGSPLPDLTLSSAQALFDRDWCERVNELTANGIAGALRPGVDGDVAVLLSLSTEFEASFRRSLAHEAARAGIELEECSEEVFTKRIAGEG